MIYQLRANLNFVKLEDAINLRTHMLQYWHRTACLNPETPHQEPSTIELIENRHDEHPYSPCTSMFLKTNAPERKAV